MWQDFVDKKDEWIGGDLIEFPDIGCKSGYETKITDIMFGYDEEYQSVAFTIQGKDFREKFNVKYGGILGKSDGEWLHFSVAYSPGFKIKKPNKSQINNN